LISQRLLPQALLLGRALSDSMFSYLRPHRRTPSNPTSPLPDQAHSWEAPSQNSTDSTYHVSSRTQDVNLQQQRPSRTASPPPFLPPINRVASYGYDQPVAPQHEDAIHENELRSQQWLSQANARGPASDSQQWAQKPRPDSAGNSGPIRPAGIQYHRPQTGGGTIQGQKERPDGEHLPFVTAADLQSSIMPPGRRPTGVRMSTPPPLAQTNVSTFEPRSSKTRLNLLNPMSLLARRRTAQVTQYPTLTPSAPNLADSNPLDGYDPRIRGTKVHDFSAPRAKRNVSHNDAQGLRDASLGFTQYQRAPSSQQGDYSQRPIEEREPNRWSGGNYTPAFTEDFDEEQYPATGPHVRKANDFTDLQLPKPPYARGTAQPSSKSPATDPEAAQMTQTRPESSRSTSLPNDSLSLQQDSIPEPPTRPAPIPVEIEKVEKAISSSSKSSTRRPRNVSQVSAKDVAMAHLPKHMKSNSSRFSFDMIGAASQEKLLEDRHRQKALEKKSSSPEPQDESSNYGEDDYDYDNMFEDDGLEERIPGVNADAEDDAFEGSVEPSLGGFTFHSMGISTATSPLSPRSPGMVSTPRDANGEVIGFAITKESPNIPFHRTSQSTVPLESPEAIARVELDQFDDDSGYHGLALQGIKTGQNHDGESQKSNITQEASPILGQISKPINHDDDLYFDDGLIDPPSDVEDAPEFDESVFDNEDTDEYGRPLRPLSSLPTLYSPPYVKLDNTQTDQGRNETGRGSRMSQELEDANSAVSPQSQHSLVLTRPTIERTNSLSQPLQQSHSLTQDTLSAYQSALAAAAYKAAANGRFRRDSSPTIHFDERDEYPDMAKDTSNATSELPIHQPLSPDYEDDFDYDDALEDDPIIAEANAEALANDSDGFYGQEFGFYSAPAGEAQFGGCFGPRGANGTVPNQNGRIVSREPNLTPITERSEYSNRNSIMSLPLSGVSHVVGSGTMSSPGLVQLAGMMNEYDEENMSLEALLKLRRGAWGGSQASLHSSNGSPMSATGEDASPFQQSPLIQSSSFGHSRQDSGYSIRSDLLVSETNSAPASPTLITSIPSKLQHNSNSTNTSGLPAPPAALLSSLNSRPMSPTSKLSSAVGIVSADSGGDKENVSFVKPRGKHRHSASSDSISYMREDDPVVGERWVLERRRTAESGEVEILGREVVSGGRI
jgi:hypothetical protein